MRSATEVEYPLHAFVWPTKALAAGRHPSVLLFFAAPHFGVLVFPPDRTSSLRMPGAGTWLDARGEDMAELELAASTQPLTIC